jgi:hypothetical protein
MTPLEWNNKWEEAVCNVCTYECINSSMKKYPVWEWRFAIVLLYFSCTDVSQTAARTYFSTSLGVDSGRCLSVGDPCCRIHCISSEIRVGVLFCKCGIPRRKKEIASERSRKLGGQLISSKREMRKKKPGITFLKKRSKTRDRRPYLLSWAEMVGAIRMFFQGVAIEFAYKLTFKPLQNSFTHFHGVGLVILKHR